MQNTQYVGLDVHKSGISVSVADGERNGELRFIGAIPNAPEAISSLAARLSQGGARLEFCYEAGPCGYGVYRQLTELNHACMVVAPSKIPSKPGDKVKTDRRDSQKLAILHRSGDLTSVWVPDETHEAMRDLTRARTDAMMQQMRARQQLLAFLLRHGRIYDTGKHWTLKHRRWLACQTFSQQAHQIVFQDYVEAVWAAEERKEQLVKCIGDMLPQWTLGGLVQALRALRGLDLISSATLVAAVGDLGRFERPGQLMSYLGLVPSEYSSGGRTRRGRITGTGSSEARRMLVEAAWSYRYPAKVAEQKSDILIKLPKPVRDIAWKAQVRLCARYRRLSASGKKSTVVVTAIARELAGFVWAVGQEVSPKPL